MSTILFTTAASQVTAADGLTIRGILSDLPSDPASIFALVLLFGSLALVLWAGLRTGKGGPTA